MLLCLYGTGSVLTPGDADHEVLAARFPDHRGARAVIRVELDRAQASCGFAVPLMAFEAERDTPCKWVERKSDEELVAYRRRRTRAASMRSPRSATGSAWMRAGARGLGRCW
jgi:hypothetical protein